MGKIMAKNSDDLKSSAKFITQMKQKKDIKCTISNTKTKVLKKSAKKKTGKQNFKKSR